MQILHVNESLDPKRGGPPAVMVRLAAAQAALGHQVTILCNDVPEAATRIRRFLATVPGFDRVRVVAAAEMSDAISRARAATAIAPAKALLKRTDVVHLHEVWLPIVRVVAMFAQRLRVPYILAPHSTLSPWSLAQRAMKKRIAMALGYRRMIDRATLIHALNSTERNLIQLLQPRAPIAILANGVFAEEYAQLPPRGQFRARHPELGDDPYVLFLSRLQSRKGPDILADAFVALSRTHPTVRLVVAGPDEGALPDLLARVEKAGLRARVHLVGPIYGSDKLSAFVDAACFCLPSREEGFSIAALEALACGSPVVLSEQCNFPEVAETQSGLVLPLDSSAIAAGLARVLDSPDLQASFSTRGRDLVFTRFTWPEIARQSIAMYERAIDFLPAMAPLTEE